MALYGIQIRNLMRMLTCLALFTLSNAHAATQTYSPSYPDVWGYDLSEVPAVKWGAAGINAYAMDDGDIWFVIPHSYHEKNSLTARSTFTDEKYLLIKFFKGEQLVLSEKEKNKIFEFIDIQRAALPSLDSEGVKFSDGSKLSLQYRSTPNSCYIPPFGYGWLVKTNLQNQEKKYIILADLPQVEMHTDPALCEAQGAPFFYTKLSMVSNIIPLKDDTFIAFSDGANLILRFNKNLHTPFKRATPVRIENNKYIMRNFYVVDYSLIEQLKSHFLPLPVPLYQSIHDALLLHFHNQYKY